VIGGRIMLEIGYDQAADVAALLQEAGYYGIEVIKDYGGNDRIVTAVKSIKQEAFS
jgi:release factor glutamine methyltransferase